MISSRIIMRNTCAPRHAYALRHGVCTRTRKGFGLVDQDQGSVCFLIHHSSPQIKTASPWEFPTPTHNSLHASLPSNTLGLQPLKNIDKYLISLSARTTNQFLLSVLVHLLGEFLSRAYFELHFSCIYAF